MPPSRYTAIFSFALCCAPVYAGPDWVEQNDAGSLVGLAQQTLGVGQIHSITGSLGGSTLVPDLEDMFLITVTNPGAFSLTIPAADFDAQLFVFNVTQANEAFGLLANNNTISGNSPLLTPFATDLTGAALTQPGVYAIAVAGAGRYPVSLNGAIFNFGSPTEVSGPDGPGGLNPHIGWAGEGATGTYSVILTGSGFYNTPAPGTGITMLAFGLLAARRQRR